LFWIFFFFNLINVWWCRTQKKKNTQCGWLLPLPIQVRGGGGGGGGNRPRKLFYREKILGEAFVPPCMPKVMPMTTTFNIKSELLSVTAKKNLNLCRKKELEWW